MRLYGTSCASCATVMLRAPGEANVCATCLAREEAAPR